MKLRVVRKWAIEEDDFIADNIEMPAIKLMMHLPNRTIHAVRYRIAFLTKARNIQRAKPRRQAINVNFLLRATGLRSNVLLSKESSMLLVLLRQVVAHIAYNRGALLIDIGRFLNRDIATVSGYARRMDELLTFDIASQQIYKIVLDRFECLSSARNN